MPPACRFTREQIVAAALAITRERGFDAATARADLVALRRSVYVGQAAEEFLTGAGLRCRGVLL